jgi:hypothetical protein
MRDHSKLLGIWRLFTNGIRRHESETIHFNPMWRESTHISFEPYWCEAKTPTSWNRVLLSSWLLFILSASYGIRSFITMWDIRLNMKMRVFWDIAPCRGTKRSSDKVYWHIPAHFEEWLLFSYWRLLKLSILFRISHWNFVLISNLLYEFLYFCTVLNAKS